MGIPHRLQQVLATQQKLEAASAYANEVNKGWAKAEWYAKDAQKLSKRQEAFAASGSSSLHAVFPAPGSASAAREAGVKTAVEVAKLARQERLRELLEKEALAYEAELNAKNLSLVKPRT